MNRFDKLLYHLRLIKFSWDPSKFLYGSRIYILLLIWYTNVNILILSGELSKML